jgi:predicted  nucleic acid-binding Zn-ribbon protein
LIVSHELLPRLQSELSSLRARIAREKTAMSQVVGDSPALNAARRRLSELAGELEKLEHTERMFIEQAHGS